MTFSKSADIFDEARGWRWRVLRASLGTTPGLIIMAMLLKKPRRGIAFGNTCDITVDGYVETEITHPQHQPRLTRIGTVIAMRDEIRRLADHCKLDDADRLALFAELNKWVRRDHRAMKEAEQESRV